MYPAVYDDMVQVASQIIIITLIIIILQPLNIKLFKLNFELFFLESYQTGQTDESFNYKGRMRSGSQGCLCRS